MTAAQIQKLYPGNQVARIAASALADDRKGDRRASSLEQETATRAAMPEHRTKFEQAIMQHQKHGKPYLVDYDMVYSVRGAFNDQGDWVYHYYHVQMAWVGYQLCLKVQGVQLV